jgi:predicted Zn finger-like uncharacterized protein
MLVQCPKCKTTYKVSDDLVKGTRPSFRCSRCKHTFELVSEPEPAAIVSSPALEEPRHDAELAFRFESRPLPQLPAVGEEPRTGAGTSMDSGPGIQARQEGEPKLPDHPSREQTSWLGTVPAPEAAKPTASNAVESSFPGTAAAREPKELAVITEARRDQRASIAPLLTVFVLLVGFFAFVAAYQKTHPAAAEQWIRRIPFLADSMLRNDQVKSAVVLKSVETKYQSLQGSRDVLVLSGTAVNQNPVMIRTVQLACRLYDNDRNEIERQTMWIGNAISTQIIRGMTAQDITDLQRLKPLKTFEIPSGDSVPFAVVFLRAGKQVNNAQCEVLSADADVDKG